MPYVPLQLGPVQSSSYEELAGASPVALNAVVDSMGAVRRRPGLAVSAQAPSTVIDSAGLYGLHSSVSGLLLATSAYEALGSVYRVTPTSAFALGSKLHMYRYPTFAETEAIVAISGASHLRRVDLAAPYTHKLLGGTPPAGTQVIAHGSRLLADDPDWNGRLGYSAQAAGSSTAGHEQWGAVVTSLGRSGFFTAEARPDRLVALKENTNEVFAFGGSTTQVFSPDATFIYATAATKEYGCGAAASVIKDEQSFAWLDDRRRFVYSDGRSFQEIGGAVRGTVEAFSTVSDCFGFRLLQGFFDGFVWVFPSEGVTLAFQKDAGWATWQGWNTVTNNWSPLIIASAEQLNDSGKTLVGTTLGTIRELTFDTQTDDGEPIPFSVTTGFRNHDTEARKRCVALHLALRRGVHAADDGKVLVEYRDSPGAWSGPREVGLGKTGDTETVVQLRGLGAYRRRQWRISAYGPEELTIASAVEEVEVLGY